jgi:hypothetical protein
MGAFLFGAAGRVLATSMTAIWICRNKKGAIAGAF